MRPQKPITEAEFLLKVTFLEIKLDTISRCYIVYRQLVKPFCKALGSFSSTFLEVGVAASKRGHIAGTRLLNNTNSFLSLNT